VHFHSRTAPWIHSSGWDRLEVNVRSLVKLALAVVLLAGVVRMGFCRGDKIIPQLADGPGLVTRFGLVNVRSAPVIINMRLVFLSQ